MRARIERAADEGQRDRCEGECRRKRESTDEVVVIIENLDM
jgi:hypothetical protein